MWLDCIFYEHNEEMLLMDLVSCKNLDTAHMLSENAVHQNVEFCNTVFTCSDCNIIKLRFSQYALRLGKDPGLV